MARPPFEERPKAGKYRPPGRPAVAESAVRAAAEQLLAAGERPTVDAVRRICGGSPNKIAPLLTRWWQGLLGRLHSQNPPTAFDRLPGQLGLIAEAFFQEAVAQADARMRAERSKELDTAAKSQMISAVRSHVLSLREQEFSERLKASDRRVATLEGELDQQLTSYRKLIAEKDVLERRVQGLLEEVARLTAARAAHRARARTKPVTKRTGKKVRRARARVTPARERREQRRGPAPKSLRVRRLSLGAKKRSRKPRKRRS